MIGSSDVPYSRTMSQHRNDFGGAVVVDSIVCANPSRVESKLKRWLNMQNRFVACKTPKKKSIETEVVVVQNQEDYRKLYEKVVEYAAEIDVASGIKSKTLPIEQFDRMTTEVLSLKREMSLLGGN